MQEIDRSLGLYIHLPFCASKCAYCTFNSFPGLERLHSRYVQALCVDIERFAESAGPLKVDTIYIGGGTPTLLEPPLLQALLDRCWAAFDVMHDAEVTVEANPGTVGLTKLRQLLLGGVNRLSLGCQSFLDHELQLLGRTHRAKEAIAALRLARQAGFDNISLDLIYGLPGQAVGEWLTTLQQAIGLAPEHLSLYALSVEAATPLGRHVGQGLLKPPDDDVAAEMYTVSADRLARHGYEQYELSNWAAAKPGQSPAAVTAMCRHNLKYWQREPYLGFGAGAHSFYEYQRWSSLADPQAYCEAVEHGFSSVEHCRTIGSVESMDETMILGLRLCWGVRFAEFQSRHGCDLRSEYATEIQELQEAGLLAATPERVSLTPRGRLLGNQVFVRFWRTGSGD